MSTPNKKPTVEELINAIEREGQQLDRFLGGLQEVYDFPIKKPLQALNRISGAITLLRDELVKPIQIEKVEPKVEV